MRDLTTSDRVFLQGPGFGRATLSPELALGVGIAVGDGCLTSSTIQGHERHSSS